MIFIQQENPAIEYQLELAMVELLYREDLITKSVVDAYGEEIKRKYNEYLMSEDKERKVNKEEMKDTALI